MELFNRNNRLHTDVLEEMFGKIDLQVLYQDNEIRESLLVDREYIARTYALTFKNAGIKQYLDISSIDVFIQQGESIGKTFRMHGYEIIKNVIAVYLIEIPWWLRVAFNTKEARAKIRISEFFVRKNSGDEMILYSTIAEIYSPLFRKAEVRSWDLLQVNPSMKSMLQLGYSRKEAEAFIKKPFDVQWAEEFTNNSREILEIKEKINIALSKK